MSGAAHMAPFDTIVMIDWSGAPDRGPVPKPDAIWASVLREEGEAVPVYFRNATDLEHWLLGLVAAECGRGRRTLVGFDFPFGYPRGVARRITGEDGPAALWDWFADAFETLPAGEGRFDIAGRLNRLLPGAGPFWFNGLQGREIDDLPRRKPVHDPDLPARREVEDLARGSFACWQMGGVGAAGSQAMTGMATLSRLRRILGRDMAVWPFAPLDGPVGVVEIWPSLARVAVRARLAEPGIPRDRKGAPIKDAAQVSALARIVGTAQAEGHLDGLLAAPSARSRQDEGWILGVGGTLGLDDIAAGAGPAGPLALPRAGV